MLPEKPVEARVQKGVCWIDIPYTTDGGGFNVHDTLLMREEEWRTLAADVEAKILEAKLAAARGEERERTIDAVIQKFIDFAYYFSPDKGKFLTDRLNKFQQEWLS